MVAKIVTGKKLRGALHYNENKVLEGTAELILASGFAGNIEQMNFNQKLQRFENLLMLNPKVKTNTLHISLNFDAAEKLSDQTLQQIAIAYMDKIGFGDQPFIAYRHYDAAHDHLHLVTTNMQRDGKPIDLHNIGCIRSENARKEIESEFKLVKAQSKQYKAEPAIKPVDLSKVLYGRLPTKRAISNTVNAVINAYQFGSLPELNAILKQFNVIADRGPEDAQMFRKRGLVYCLLDEKGNKVGVPIKSSSLYTKPTLQWLEEQFPKHQVNKIAHNPALKATIDKVIAANPGNKSEFVNALKAQGVAVLFRNNEQNETYGITFIDHIHKTVFNGSSLGKAYTAKAVLSQLGKGVSTQKALNPLQMSIQNKPLLAGTKEERMSKQHDDLHSETHPKVLETLLKGTQEYAGWMPRKKRKKKRTLKI
ncbi:relaxase/mobilization nuclease domain-containing protein [Pedobacter panaciterrae]|uniref:relaxase/mobilization nuclease domain-containing protein n=1 Tax=Pedobacter panaciterrae TaxID=363849 RepID=UPI00155DC23E|nr:relaxase/mobilization nuclease domain-containing protein [Pedobacter panaciterrae]NQX56923.1 relaxase/mobilization nuclease domain-containing protein [Pedobacter panaciterrae]